MYKASIEYMGVTFEHAWQHAVDELLLGGRSSGEAVVRYFKENYNIELIYGIPTDRYGNNFGWQYAKFKSESAYVMFMLEWS
jgi:hypothetical protein